MQSCASLWNLYVGQHDLGVMILSSKKLRYLPSVKNHALLTRTNVSGIELSEGVSSHWMVSWLTAAPA